MSSQAPRGRQTTGSGRSGGGRALMLFGVLLALLSGVLVIYIVSQATSSAGESVELVVANQNVPKNTLMTPQTIAADFGIEKFPSNLVPAGAFVYTTQNALDVHLANQVNLYPLVPGDILLSSDSRFISATGPGVTITNLDPQELPTGDLLYAFNYSYASNSTQSFINPGDHVDVLALECNKPFSTTGECIDSVTLQNLLVYTTFSSSVVLVVSPAQAEQLAILAQSGTVQLALRNPTDKTVLPAGVLTPESVAQAFGYCTSNC